MDSRAEPLHPDVERLLSDYRAAGIPALSADTPESARRLLTALRPAREDAAAMEAIREEVISGGGGPIGVRTNVPQGAATATILFFHGGGWVVGDLDTSDFAVRALARATGCRIVSVDYRLAPEHPFPAAIEDAAAALDWVLQRHGADGPVAVAGDSAGGNLAAVIASQSRGWFAQGLAAQILIYPVLDGACDTRSYADNQGAVPLSSEDMLWCWAHYCPDPADRLSVRASPLRLPSLAGLPPTFLGLADHDPLLDEGLAFAERLRAAQVPLTAQVYPGTVHGFFSSPDRLEPARTLLHDIADFLRRTLNLPAWPGEGEN